MRVWALQPDQSGSVAELTGHHGFVRALAVSGRRFSTCSARLDDTAAIGAALDRLRPKYVVCAAGANVDSPLRSSVVRRPESRRSGTASRPTLADAHVD